MSACVCGYVASSNLYNEDDERIMQLPYSLQFFVKSDYPHNLQQLSRLDNRKYTTTFEENCLEWQHNLLPDFYINTYFIHG